jgi:transposase
MLHAGLDLSRRRADVCLLSDRGEPVAETAAPADVDGLRCPVERVAVPRERVRAVIESMNGARFVHDTLEELGWEVLVADAHKVKGLAPLACKTAKIDARVLAELSQRDLVPAIWLPDPSIRRERELARFRLHLVWHRTTLKNRIHATLMTFGHPCPVSDLFGLAGRELLDRLAIPDPWRRNVDAGLELIDDLELQIARLTVELKRQGADHRYILHRARRALPLIATVTTLTPAAREHRHPPHPPVAVVASGLPARTEGLSVAHGWVALLDPFDARFAADRITIGSQTITTTIIVTPGE